MQPPLTPGSEPERLAALRALRILDTPPEERFERLTRLAEVALDVPIVAISLVDEDRQWFKSCIGLGVRETERSVSFCGHAILSPGIMVVEDAAADERFADNPLVTGPPHIRFYAGRPLADADGHRLGTLCVIDTEPRTLSAREERLLDHLADLCSEELTSIGREAAIRRYESTIDAMAEGVIVARRDAGIIEVNEAARDILGLPEDELWSMRSFTDHWTVVDDEGRELARSELPSARTFTTGLPTDGVVLGLQRAGRPTVWLSVNCRALPGPDGDPLWGLVVTFSDVSRQREIERMKSEFVSVVSHELRTPLTTIRGALGLLGSGMVGPLDGEAAQMLGLATSSADRLGRLIDDILNVERIESGRVSLQREWVEVAGLVEEAAAVVEPMAGEAGVKLVTEAEALSAWVDRDRIVQLLVNLIDNAVKYSPEGGEVRAGCSVEADRLVLRVTDRGRGIPASKLESIFERFEQVDASDSRDKGGTGLGLAICRSIAEQHGGRIEVSSRLGRGSTFTCTLPVAGPGAPPTGPGTSR